MCQVMLIYCSNQSAENRNHPAVERTQSRRQPLTVRPHWALGVILVFDANGVSHALGQTAASVFSALI